MLQCAHRDNTEYTEITSTSIDPETKTAVDQMAVFGFQGAA